MERNQNKNNIIISQYKPREEHGRKLTEEIEDMLRVKTKEKVLVESVQRINTNTETKFLVKMRDFEDKLKIFRNKKELFNEVDGKKYPIYVSDDLIKVDRDVQKLARDACREERKRGNDAKVGYKKIFINGKEHKWNEDVNDFSAEKK